MYGLYLFFVWFLFLECSVFSRVSPSDCQFNLTNGNWEEFSTFASDIYSCVGRSKKSDIHLQLKNYTLPAFANATFSNLGHVKSLSLQIENSRIQILSPTVPGYSIFQNSSFDSVDFSVFDSSTLAGWKWRALRSIDITSSKGFKFLAVRSKLVYLHSDFGTVAKGQLTEVRILKCGLRWLGENVFAPLVRLRTLELRDNLLDSIRRSHLPEHASDLRVLDLGNNRLTYLPKDFLEGLNLQTLLLDGNKLRNPDQLARMILNRQKRYLSGIQWPCKLGDRKLEEFANYLKKFHAGLNQINC